MVETKRFLTAVSQEPAVRSTVSGHSVTETSASLSSSLATMASIGGNRSASNSPILGNHLASAEVAMDCGENVQISIIDPGLDTLNASSMALTYDP